MLWPIVPCIALAAPLYAWFVLRGGARHPWLAFLPGAAAVLATPWLIPADQHVLRFFVALWAFVTTFRLADVAWDRYPTPTARLSFARFLVLFVVAPDLRYPHDRHDRIEAHRDGLRRMGRGLLQGAGVLVMMVIGGAVPQVHVWGPIQMLWCLFIAWFFLGSTTNVLTGFAMWVGWMWVGELFENPPGAASPREFWSQRWNLVFHNLALRHIFKPLGGRERFWLAGAAVFAFSALVHEYLVVAALGETHFHMTAFFAVHAAGTLGYTALRRSREGNPMMPRPIGVAAHLTWMWATAFLFFPPMLEIFSTRWFVLG